MDRKRERVVRIGSWVTELARIGSSGYRSLLMLPSAESVT